MRIFIFFICLFWVSACATVTEVDPRMAKYGKIGNILGLISKNYVGETNWINDDYFDEVVRSEKELPLVIHEAVERLDSRSEYYDEEEFLALRLGDSKSQASIGVSLSAIDDKVVVSRVTPNSPAYRSDVLPGDQIISVDSKEVANFGVSSISQSLKGMPGSEVMASFRRSGLNRTFSFIREIDTEENVTLHLENSVPVLRFFKFDATTVNETAELITALDLEPDGPLEALVIDLRGNAGGLLDSCFGMAELFLDGGDVFYTQGREVTDIQEYTAEKGDILQGKPIIILVNEFTASGAELFARSMQFRKRAIIVGTQTFGDGIIQTVIPLEGGRLGALKIASHKMYVGDGIEIDKIGVTPDVNISGSSNDFLKRAAQIALSEIKSKY